MRRVMRRACEDALEKQKQRQNGLYSLYETVWVCLARDGESLLAASGQGLCIEL
jgi:hypothetical protein